MSADFGVYNAYGPNIKVIGVGGGGGNAVNRMIAADIKAATFIVANTDIQALNASKAPIRIQLGAKVTKGLGAGSNPDVGKQAAEESTDEINKCLENTDLLFIAAGMGGGTGTGAAPVIAKLAKEKDILTVAVVTKPFESFEGKVRTERAEAGIEELRKYVDTLLVVSNERICSYVPKGTSFNRAFQIADEVLVQGVVGITNIIVQNAEINLDFADIRTTMKNKGNAHIGIGRGKGENRTLIAVQQAVNSALLETSIKGATNVIVYVSGGGGVTVDEVRDAVSLIQQVLDPDANVIFGMGTNPELGDEIMVTVIATGFENSNANPNNYGMADQYLFNPGLQTQQPQPPRPAPSPYGGNAPFGADPYSSRTGGYGGYNPYQSDAPADRPNTFDAGKQKSDYNIPSPGIDNDEDNDVPAFLRGMKR